MVAPRRRFSAWAVRVRGGGLHVLLIDKSRRPVAVALRLPANAPAQVDRLLAPSIRSSSGVTLDGQRLGRDGKWLGRPDGETATPSRGRYELEVPGQSAALMEVHAG